MREAAQTDWEAIEAAYRAGVLSLREIARQHSLAVSTLHKRVRVKGWQRDLSSAVRQEAQSRLARELAPPPDPEEQERGDRKIVDAAAATQVEVVRQHRNTLSRSRDIANRLLDELDATTGHIGEIEAVIVAATAGDDSPKRREAMMRAVSLPSRASTLANLAHSLDKFHKLDRQAFGIEAKPLDETQSAEAARLLELRARWKAMTPLQKARTLAAYIEERMREVRAAAPAQALNGDAPSSANQADSARP